ncbi:MAG TPA: Sip1-related alpha-galactosidase, partial [Polyangiaceae bacterium]|nr:Sip1-related alpha-galactosidase [Polyangiaceae bacterium]
MNQSHLLAGVLSVDGVPLLEGVSDELSLESAPRGAFLLARRQAPSARFRSGLGRPRGLSRFVASYRYQPYWMKPRVGTRVSDIPRDTQLLLLELESGKVALFAPLALAPFRASLEGKGDELLAIVDSGDPATLGSEALLLYVAVGDDPYALAREGAALVAKRLGTVRLRRDKTLPAFADDFGWCTWDAFYQEVSHDKVQEGLRSFRAGGVEPRVVILDDGWQSVQSAVTGEKRLTAFAANDKFPGGLSLTVRLAKDEYGVRTFLVWHAVHGYWGGIDAEALPDYGVETALRWYSPEVLSHAPDLNCDWWGSCVGRPSPAGLARLYDDYHRYLGTQGVDGVKVDNQASVEGLGHGLGGRVSYMQEHRHALESSVRRHFAGRLINCMSCSSEMIYQAMDSSLTRSSTDFWPKIASSHGEHVYTNAM